MNKYDIRDKDDIAWSQQLEKWIEITELVEKEHRIDLQNMQENVLILFCVCSQGQWSFEAHFWPSVLTLQRV